MKKLSSTGPVPCIANLLNILMSMLDNFFFLKINVWDTAGMERTRSLTSNYYRNSHAVIFVYAVDDMYSLTVLRSWVEDVNKDAPEALKFLVGNKMDLKDEGIQVDKKQAESFRKNNELKKLYEVSAKDGAGVKDMFDDIAKMLVQNKQATVKDTNAFAVIRAESEQASKKSSGDTHHCSC